MGYEDLDTKDVFVTDKKSKATKYAAKFNKVLEKWKDHYKQFEMGKRGSIQWLKEEFEEQHFNRWNRLRNTNKCYWEEIETR